MTQQSPDQPGVGSVGDELVLKDVHMDEGRSWKCCERDWSIYETDSVAEDELTVGMEYGVGIFVERGISKWNDVWRIFELALVPLDVGSVVVTNL